MLEETSSGTRSDWPVLGEVVNFARPGDTIACCRLDRIARSVYDLTSRVRDLDDRGIGFRA